MLPLHHTSQVSHLVFRIYSVALTLSSKFFLPRPFGPQRRQHSLTAAFFKKRATYRHQRLRDGIGRQGLVQTGVCRFTKCVGYSFEDPSFVGVVHTCSFFNCRTSQLSGPTMVICMRATYSRSLTVKRFQLSQRRNLCKRFTASPLVVASSSPSRTSRSKRPAPAVSGRWRR